MNSTIVFLFKRTHTPTPPLIPSGTLSYSFSSGFVSGVLNGWSQSLPVTGGAYRWVTSAVVTGESDSTVINISAWRAVAMLSEDGTARHTATIYKQSILDPGSPIASTSSYDFVLGVLVSPVGWSVTQPATTTINTWAAEYTFVGLDDETVIGTGYWGQTKVVAVAGVDGQNTHVVTIYKQTIEDVDYPAGGSYKFDGDILVAPAGWSRTMPTVSDVPTYMSTHRFSSNDPLEVILGTSWSYPVVIARMGYDYINRFNSVCFKYSLDQPATPVEGDYDNPVPTGWGDGIPALVEGQSLWSTSRMFYADNLLSTVWATPVKVSGNTSLSSKLQFSADNILWHDEPTTNDIYMRSGTNDGNGWVFSASVVIKGEGGDKGDTGNTGVQLYMWIAYAFDLGGVSGFTTGSPTSEHKCIGVAKNKTSAIESTDPADYIWTEWVGARGPVGANGVTTFTWYAYANSQDGVTDFTTGDWNNHSYIGMAFNKFTNVESLDATDYVWAKLNVTAQVTGICFLPSLEQPSTPLGGTFIEPTGIGWFDGIPDLNNLPLWVSTRIFTSDGLAPQQASWTTPVKIGAPTNSVFLQFSIDNANWHDTPTSNDIYMRSGTSVNGGAVTWSAGVKIKGETGALGSPGATGSTGATGDSVIKAFIDSSSPTTPSASTGIPSGWTSSIPVTAAIAIWESTGTRAAGTTLYYWTTPIITAASWRKPGTVTIDGARIFADEAYVDTLQIKGDAVTVPRFYKSGNIVLGTSMTTVLLVYHPVPVGGKLGVHGLLHMSGTFGDGALSNYRLLIGGEVVLNFEGNFGGVFAGMQKIVIGAANVTAATYSIEVQASSNNGATGHVVLTATSFQR